MKIKAFKGFRPLPDKVIEVASRPYDVLTSLEAREEANGNPYSFLNVVKPEITLPEDTDPYCSEVYEAGKNNFRKLVEQGIFFQDQHECLYLYGLTMNGRTQTGIVACASIDDYMNDRIKKHELTRPDKEADRKNHMRISMLNAEPVFLAYKSVKDLDVICENIESTDPVYDFTAGDGVGHKFWVITDPGTIENIIKAFENLPASYVADGHHRTAAAALVGNDLKNANPDHSGAEEYNYFLAVHFPDDQLAILDYNRVVSDLNGYEVDPFIEELAEAFSIEKSGKQAYKPDKLHTIGMYLNGNWYALTAKPGSYDDSDPIAVLDVTILSERILKPVLDIHDLRTDSRIDFVGGSRGLEELQRRVDSGEMAVAFALYPVSMQQLMDIADNGLIMPPKVTWFEPKLRSGLVVHCMEDKF